MKAPAWLKVDHLVKVLNYVYESVMQWPAPEILRGALEAGEEGLRLSFAQLRRLSSPSEFVHHLDHGGVVRKARLLQEGPDVPAQGL